MFVIHRAERADVLADALSDLLADIPADPFAADVVAVPTQGIERWLAQRLSARLGTRIGEPDGVCANVEFPSPGGLVAQALALASGIVPQEDPWRPARLVWPLIEVVQSASEEEWLEPLSRHLREGREHRYARLAHLARLYDQYAIRRPELIIAWARGDSGGVDERAAAGWQPELWRRLREAVGLPSPAERLEPACTQLERKPEVVPLPQRLALFGITRLPVSHLRVMHALAARRDVHLLLLHPSPEMWASGEPRNRLLASWGRDVLGLQRLVSEAEAGADRHHPLPEAGAPSTLLAALQSDIRVDRQPPGPPLRAGEPDARMPLTASDHSVRIHACHGRARQVEVLREAILHRLADDPTLEPRDVIVMCPDIESFAPLIEAAFAGRAPAHWSDADDAPQAVAGEPPALRVRLADRSLRGTTPVLAVTARLLELASGRVTVSEVLDLADTAPIRMRFRFGDDELTQIRAWLASAEIHWGLDSAARAPYRLDAVDAGTWAAGLRRLMLGVAVDPEVHTLLHGVLPAIAIESSEIELSGRLAELVDRLDAALHALAGPHTIRGWAAALRNAADVLMATAKHESWQRAQLDAILEEILADGSDGIELTLSELRALLGQRLEGRPTRANFRSGHLTFCTLVPMRSVPHRVVCLLGLDDGAFPRQASRDGDNLLLADPQPGDRNPRTEDRQLLLDALLAARDALIITYSGNDERTNAALPPAVPVGELLDAIDATAWTPDATRASARVVIRHPLQPFDPRNFSPASVGLAPLPDAPLAAGPWSFDATGLAGARAALAPRDMPPPFLPEPLPPAPGDELVTLDELIVFLQRPVRAFLRQRLGITTRRDEQEPDDALPLELDGLTRWGVGQRLLQAVLAGVQPREAVLAEIARGSLPPGTLAKPVLERLWPDVEAIAAAARAHAASRAPRSEQTNLTLPDGMRLTGAVGGLHGHVLLSVSYSRLGPRQRLASWIRLLALNAANPEIPSEAVTIGRGGDSGSVQVARIPQLGGTARVRAAAAVAQLTPLAAMRAEGLRQPLPLPCATAHAYAEAARRGDDPAAAAMREWRSGWTDAGLREREDSEPEHRLALGPELDLDRLGALATAIWEPLLAREVLEG